MSKKYYIPDLPFIRKHIKGFSRALIVKGETNLVELNSEKDVNTFLQSIQKSEFINDEELLANVKDSLPGVENFFSEIPILQPELMEALMFIFTDYPPDLLDNDTILIGLKKFFNHIIRKNETSFIINNIRNGTLLYDNKWKFKKSQDFYFQMKKTVYNLDTYYLFFSNAQYLLRNTALREISFSDEIITDEKEQLLNRVFNICGNNFFDMQKRLVHMKNQIITNRRELKRNGLVSRLPTRYEEMERQALKKINLIIEDLEQKIKDSDEAKVRFREEVRRRHGIFSKRTLNKLFREFKWLRPFIKK